MHFNVALTHLQRPSYNHNVSVRSTTLMPLGEWSRTAATRCRPSSIPSQKDLATVDRETDTYSFISASHVTKTRHAHQVTAGSLHCLSHQAYTEQCPATEADVTPGFDEWCAQQAKRSVHLDYWLKVLSLDIMLLVYVTSLREGNFDLYVQSLAQIVPWMFELDHTHYSRWLSVHIRDMTSLSVNHPNIHAEFRAGQFVVHKTRNKFSAMAIDQCHEQNNGAVKGSGGAVGLTANPAALRRWTVAGPEVARLVAEFEEDQVDGGPGAKRNIEGVHHEQQPGGRSAFLKDVQSLTIVLQDMGNPFLEESNDLLVLDTKYIMESVDGTVRKVETIGQEQYSKFVDERLSMCVTPVSDPLPKNKLPIFSRPAVKAPSKGKLQLQSMKSDCNLFSRPYLACQAIYGDVDQFFSQKIMLANNL